MAWAATQPSWRKPWPLRFPAPRASPSFQPSREQPEDAAIALKRPTCGRACSPDQGQSEEEVRKWWRLHPLPFLPAAVARPWWNLAAKNLFLFPRRRGTWLALLDGTEGGEQPTSFTCYAKKLFCLWPCGCEIQFFLKFLTDGSMRGCANKWCSRGIVNEQGGSAQGSIRLLSPHSFRAALWRGCWQHREWAMCCHREGDGRALAICEHLWDSWAFNTPLGWVRSVHTANFME